MFRFFFCYCSTSPCLARQQAKELSVVAFVAFRKSSICRVWTFWRLRHSRFFLPYARARNKNTISVLRSYTSYEHRNIKSYFHHLLSSLLFWFRFFFLTFFEPKMHLCDRCKNVNTKYEGFVSGFAESDDTHADGHGNNNNEKRKKEFTQKRGINTKEYSRTISVAARARAHHQSFASVFLFVDDIVVDLFFFHSSPFSLLLLFHIYFLVDVAAASDAAWSCLLSMISFLFYCVLFFCYSFCVALHPKESLKKKLCVCVECEQQQASPSETEMMWIVESFCWKEPEENVTHSQSHFNGNCSQDCLYRFFLFLR